MVNITDFSKNFLTTMFKNKIESTETVLSIHKRLSNNQEKQNDSDYVSRVKGTFTRQLLHVKHPGLEII